jgi:predicted SAM-dependent methyltransferase
MVKINLGSGHWKFYGWVNVDLDIESAPEVCVDLSAGLPFQTGVADLMHSEDFVDQLQIQQAAAFFRECHRILKPGGVLRVLTPDLEQLARLYLHDPVRLAAMWSEFVREPLLLDTPGEIFNMGMRFAGHTFLYDGESFTALLAQCGFEARRVSYQNSGIADLRGLDLRSPENAVSMYFDCYRLGS